MDFPSNDSYFSLLNLSFVENCHISIFTTFAKQSMINRLSNAINRNRSAAKISKVMSSSLDPPQNQANAHFPEAQFAANILLIRGISGNDLVKD